MLQPNYHSLTWVHEAAAYKVKIMLVMELD